MSVTPHPREPGREPASARGPTAPGASIGSLPVHRVAALFELQTTLLQALGRPAERERLFRLIAERAALLLDASAIVCTVEPEGDALLARVGTGALAAQEGTLLPLEGSFEGMAASAGASARTAALRADPRAYLADERELPAGPALAVALPGAGVGAVGVLLLAREAGEPEFSAEDETCALLAAPAVGGALEGAAAYARARGSRAALERWRAARGAGSEAGRQLLRALRHELNNPLAAVLGHVQLLEADAAVRGLPHVAQSVRAIREEGERIESLTRRLAALEASGDARLLDDEGFLRLPPDPGPGRRGGAMGDD